MTKLTSVSCLESGATIAVGPDDFEFFSVRFEGMVKK